MSVRPLSGRVALVTGANHGIGGATAVALGELGADVALTYWRLSNDDDDPGRPPEYARFRRQGPDAAVSSVIAAGGAAHPIEADLSDPDVPAQLLDEVEQVLGPVAILVHNASGWRKDTFAPDAADRFARRTERVNTATFDAQFHVDTRAGALLMAEFATRHRLRHADWGRIVALTSGGPNGFPGEVSYGAAKAALENYTMSAAIELAPLGITANVVYPAVTDTGWVTDDVRRFVAGSDDHVHVAAPSEVAAVIAWLCTDDAFLVTGNVIRLR
jgi:3-oxoacyl-[acyl-carrier protein] reductase